MWLYKCQVSAIIKFLREWLSEWQNDRAGKTSGKDRGGMEWSWSFSSFYCKYFLLLFELILIPIPNLQPFSTMQLCIRYNPVRSQILIAPARGVSVTLSDQLEAALSDYYRNDMSGTVPLYDKLKLQFAHIRSLYPRFQYTDIASHKAIVILPYQVCPALPCLFTCPQSICKLQLIRMSLFSI